MPLRGSRRMEALAARSPRRRPWRIRLAILISLLIHVGVVVLLLVTVKRERTSELLPPPAPVTMVFETGRKTGPTLPNPSPQATPSAPPGPEAPPVEAAPRPAPPLPPAPIAPPPPPAPAPTAPIAPPQIPAPAPTAPVGLPPLSAPALPPVEAPSENPVPPPPASRTEPVPTPPRQPKLLPAPKPPTKTPVPPRSPDFPAPMDFSFGKPPPAALSPGRSPSRLHFPGTIDMSLGPASKGTADPTPFSERDEDAAGADWRNALSRWVAEHAYYPEQARRDLDEGDAKVRVRMEPNGRVKEVQLIGKSGSMWLDLALLALFRDQHIPALPSGETQPFEFDFTMHYILIRSR